MLCPFSNPSGRFGGEPRTQWIVWSYWFRHADRRPWDQAGISLICVYARACDDICYWVPVDSDCPEALVLSCECGCTTAVPRVQYNGRVTDILRCK
jgi:hypothetical protein